MFCDCISSWTSPTLIFTLLLTSGFTLSAPALFLLQSIFLLNTSSFTILSCFSLLQLSTFHFIESVLLIYTNDAIIDAQRGKKTRLPNVNSEDPSEGAYPCSQIWNFSVRRHTLQYPLILYEDNEDTDQPAQSRRLIRACVVRYLRKGHFRM